VEIRLLKQIFTPEEAEIATHMQFLPLPVEKIHRRVKKSGITVEELKEKLDTMGQKGSINFGTANGKKHFGLATFAVGFFEYQLGRLTKEFCEDSQQYAKEAFIKEFNLTKLPQLRTIPISQTMDIDDMIETYDGVKNLIMERTGPIAVGECVCRQEKDILGKPCKQSEIRETCFFFGVGAAMYVEKEQARMISKEEALKILKRAEEAGFVLQPTNSKRPMGICCCCGCCCGVLTHQKMLSDKPVQFFNTNFYSEVDADMCSGCETCLDRCQMEAIDIVDDVATINLDKCIGCGLCVSTCPSEAMSLKKKDEEYEPPKNTMDFYQKVMDIKASLARAKKL
jgi:ferredoxin